jgi:hypothetical protein
MKLKLEMYFEVYKKTFLRRRCRVHHMNHGKAYKNLKAKTLRAFLPDSADWLI